MKLQQFARSAMVLIGWSLALNVWAIGDKPLRIIAIVKKFDIQPN